MSGNSKLRWINIAKEFYLASENDAVFRNEKSCREHWINNLDPHNNKFLKFSLKIKKNLRLSWSDDEDLILLKEYMQNSGKWSLISQKLSGRNCYSVKNRFESLCRKFNVKKESDSLGKEVETMYQTIYESKKHQKNENEEQTIPKKQIPLTMGTTMATPQNPIIMNPCTFFIYILMS